MKATKKAKLFALKNLKRERLEKKKKLKGFTLVELIVVIAIIGVLAIVLIPNMMSYIAKAKLATANDTAAKVAEQANLVAADLEVRGKQCSGTYYASAESIKAEGEDKDSFAYQIHQALPEFDWNAKLLIHFGSNNQVDCVVYAANGTTNRVGTYPTQTTIDDIDGVTFDDFKDGKHAMKSESGLATDDAYPGDAKPAE